MDIAERRGSVKKYLRGTDGNLGNTSERRGGMAIVITRWRCVQGAKYDCCGGLVVEWRVRDEGRTQGVRRQKISLSKINMKHKAITRNSRGEMVLTSTE